MTGASRGIGKAVALELGRAGCKVRTCMFRRFWVLVWGVWGSKQTPASLPPCGSRSLLDSFTPHLVLFDPTNRSDKPPPKNKKTQVVVNYASSADSANEVVKEIKVRPYT